MGTYQTYLSNVCSLYLHNLPAVDDRNGDAIWNSSGCHVKSLVVDTIEPTVIVCSCDHMTSFAVLTAGSSAASSGSESERTAISSLSYIGVGISIVCYVVMLTLYAVFERARRELSKRVSDLTSVCPQSKALNIACCSHCLLSRLSRSKRKIGV